MKIVFDTNVVDAIADTPGLLEAIIQASEDGRLTLLTTHIQADEILATPDEARRAKLVSVYGALPTDQVATHGFVLDASRLDMARLGDGGWTGVTIDDIDSPKWKHRRDALIGVTAAGEADVLVTCDGRLARRMRAVKPRCDIWDLRQFVDYVLMAKREEDTE